MSSKFWQLTGLHRLTFALHTVLSGPLRNVRLHLTVATVLALGASGLQGLVLLLIQQLLTGIVPTTSPALDRGGLGESFYGPQPIAATILLVLLVSALLEFIKDRVIFLAWRRVERSSIDSILIAILGAQERGAFDLSLATDKSFQSLVGVSSRIGALTRVVAGGFTAAASSFAFVATALFLDLRLGLLIFAVVVPVAVANLAIVGRRVTSHARNMSLLASEARYELANRLVQAASGERESCLPPLRAWRSSVILSRSRHSVGRLQEISSGRFATSMIFALTIAGLIWFSLSSSQPANVELPQVVLVTVALIAALRQFSATLSNLLQTARFLPAVDQYETVLRIIQTSNTPAGLRAKLSSAVQRLGVSNDSGNDEEL